MARRWELAVPKDAGVQHAYVSSDRYELWHRVEFERELWELHAPSGVTLFAQYDLPGISLDGPPLNWANQQLKGLGIRCTHKR